MQCVPLTQSKLLYTQTTKWLFKWHVDSTVFECYFKHKHPEHLNWLQNLQQTSFNLNTTKITFFYFYRLLQTNIQSNFFPMTKSLSRNETELNRLLCCNLMNVEIFLILNGSYRPNKPMLFWTRNRISVSEMGKSVISAVIGKYTNRNFILISPFNINKIENMIF